MGRGKGGKRGRTQRRDFRDGRENVWKKPREQGDGDGDGDGGWAPFVVESPAFEEYYKKQGIVPESEWEQFMACLRKSLPTTFRINGGGQYAECIRDQMRRDFFDCLKDETEIDGEVIEPPRTLPWYPNDLAWHLSFSRRQLRKASILQRIHEFLKEENELGNITRQEAVSMVPPLFLDVKPNHRILDMCAAPGSKTFQLLEVIHKDDQPGALSQGMVIANDLNVQRCHLLIHQTKRMCSPNILVTNHEAQHFPGLKKKKLEVDVKDKEPSIGDDTGLLFDRVLCDVPCSGDGTMRKAPDLWKKWSPGMGNGLHCLQIQIAMRGVALLEVGGRMVYSTCSLNPIEDEAVVGEILRQSGGCMELLDVSSELPTLRRRPGLKSWKVRGRRRWFSSYHEDKYRAVLPSMFPSGKRMAQITREREGDMDSGNNVENPSEEATESEAEVSELPLERCMRILPHDQDTGGFFIAAFQKVGPYKRVSNSFSGKKSRGRGKAPQEAEENVDNDTENPEAVDNDNEPDNAQSAELELDSQRENRKQQKQGPWHGVDPVLFLEDDQIIRSLASYYGIQESLPLSGHLVVRSEDTSRVKRIYYVSKSVGDVARLNFRSGQMLKITSAGLKIFERHSNKEDASACNFRIASEGLPLLLPHLTKQLLYATKDDFKLLLSPSAVPFVAFKDPAFTSAMQSLLVGCCVVVLKDSVGTNDVTAVGCWRGRTNMSLLVPRVEADQMLKRLFPEEVEAGDRTSNPVNANEDDTLEEQKGDEMDEHTIEEDEGEEKGDEKDGRHTLEGQ
ncbi:tRNA (cytosine(34)-C(5))-methyltransferase [Selaginella moellendorffii]|uniref:tRNA (cytosine(34)-C(5))-methyltransferase n=1 Tax=Selaginella moellendorffii TaxID=88036 RepID=UPI000D1C59EC|nr:tRNA (cytosine(34)-C(5))-methyltransferase [Selaginella moellendorffii]|eukprot:XP_024545501.1 tRNA (cytosine(34)-C(5))-methyltransferase [Selaginella moellendorffii]